MNTDRVRSPPRKSGVRSTAGETKIADNVKSMLCEDLIWDIREDSFALELPYKAETRELTDWAFDHGDIVAEYTHVTRGLAKRRFRFSLPKYRRVLQACKRS